MIPGAALTSSPVGTELSQSIACSLSGISGPDLSGRRKKFKKEFQDTR